jgi:hypothetical protein
MVNGSFVFGMDEHDEAVFPRTVEWAIAHGIETATFHVLTPYPGTALHARIRVAGRLLHEDWDLYDTRHTVFRPARLTPEQLERGYWKAYRDFYRWGSILRGASAKPTLRGALRHAAYAAGWKKFEPLWDLIRLKRAHACGARRVLDEDARSLARQARFGHDRSRAALLLACCFGGSGRAGDGPRSFSGRTALRARKAGGRRRSAERRRRRVVSGVHRPSLHTCRTPRRPAPASS